MNTEFAIFIVTTLVLVFIFYAIIRHWNKKEFKIPEIVVEPGDSLPNIARLNVNPYYEKPKNPLRHTPLETNHSVKYEEPPRNEYMIPLLFVQEPYPADAPNRFEADAAELQKTSPHLFAEAPISESSNYYDSCSSDSSYSDSSSSCSSGGGD